MLRHKRLYWKETTDSAMLPDVIEGGRPEQADRCASGRLGDGLLRFGDLFRRDLSGCA